MISSCTARIVALAFTFVLFVTTVLAQQRPVGRWVNRDSTDLAFLVLDIESDGSVHLLMPAPQFSAAYSLDAERVLIRMGDGSTSSLVFRGDTLFRDDQPALTRMVGTPEAKGRLGGTWHPVTPGPLEQFWTFRSDGQLILEVGLPGTATLSGTALKVADRRFTLREAGGTLYLDGGDKSRQFVRRQWGCFRATQSDGSASECQP
jgi:hypothetical protein